MLRLIVQTESRWVDLALGVRVKLRPLNSATDMAAENVARVENEKRRKALEDAGRADPFEGAGWVGPSYAEKTAALAALLIEEWQGVGTADGTADLELTPENAAALVRQVPTVAHAFTAAIQEPLRAMVAEGNGSGGSPRTTSAPGASIARPAASPSAESATGAPTPPPPPSQPMASRVGSPAAPV